MLAELNKFGQFLTGRMKFFRTKREQLSPVWTDVKRRQFSLDYRQKPEDRRQIGFQREVNCDARFFVAGAHPQVVVRNGADF